MATYKSTLPEVFPQSVGELTAKQAKELAAILIDHGSSFAVTVDAPITLWLSQASADHLNELYAEEGM